MTESACSPNYNNTMKKTLASLVLVTACAIANIARAQTATTTIYACYIEKAGTVYRIKAPNAPTACAKNRIPFSGIRPALIDHARLWRKAERSRKSSR